MSGATVVGGASLEWAIATDVGKHRSLNEDSVLDAPPVFVVADGMGGHEAGEIASGLTVERFRTLAGPDPISIDAVSQELHTINSLLRDASQSGSDSVMGTTGVGMAVVDNGGVVSWLVFNVGDSRAYSMADGVLTQVSRDHSFVQELVDSGEIDAEAARVHPHRNVVTRALGADAEVRPDYWVRPIRAGERFLLCSDGLTGEVEDSVIAAVLGAGLPPGDSVQMLIDLALENGGHDNVTAIIIDVVGVPALDDSSTERNSSKVHRLRAAPAEPDAAPVEPAAAYASEVEEDTTGHPDPDEPVTHQLIAVPAVPSVPEPSFAPAPSSVPEPAPPPAPAVEEITAQPRLRLPAPTPGSLGFSAPLPVDRIAPPPGSVSRAAASAPDASGDELIAAVPSGAEPAAAAASSADEVAPAPISSVPLASSLPPGDGEPDHIPVIFSMPEELSPELPPPPSADEGPKRKVDLNVLKAFKKGRKKDRGD